MLTTDLLACQGLCAQSYSLIEIGPPGGLWALFSKFLCWLDPVLGGGLAKKWLSPKLQNWGCSLSMESVLSKMNIVHVHFWWKGMWKWTSIYPRQFLPRAKNHILLAFCVATSRESSKSLFFDIQSGLATVRLADPNRPKINHLRPKWSMLVLRMLKSSSQ